MENGPLDIDGRTIDVSSVDKVLFGDDITKGDLVEYAVAIAPIAVPHLADRPVALKRYPDGIEQKGFFQKQASDHFPAWVTTVPVATSDRTIDHVVVDQAATLVYLADQGTIELHAWLSRTGSLDHPDEMIFDLDPPPDASVDEVRWAARRTRDLLDELELPALLKTSGSAGYHVHVPLDQRADFDAVRQFAHATADLLARRHPSRLTVAQRKDRREGRVFVDYLRNGYGQTAVAPYSVRARPGAPVATPIDWDELGRVAPQRYGIGNIMRRLGQKEDPWAHVPDGVGLGPATERLNALLEEADAGR